MQLSMLLFYAWVAFVASLLLSVIVAAVLGGREAAGSDEPENEDNEYGEGAPLDDDAFEEAPLDDAPLDGGEAEFASAESSEFGEFDDDFK